MGSGRHLDIIFHCVKEKRKHEVEGFNLLVARIISHEQEVEWNPDNKDAIRGEVFTPTLSSQQTPGCYATDFIIL